MCRSTTSTQKYLPKLYSHTLCKMRINLTYQHSTPLNANNSTEQVHIDIGAEYANKAE